MMRLLACLASAPDTGLTNLPSINDNGESDKCPVWKITWVHKKLNKKIEILCRIVYGMCVAKSTLSKWLYMQWLLKVGGDGSTTIYQLVSATSTQRSVPSSPPSYNQCSHDHHIAKPNNTSTFIGEQIIVNSLTSFLFSVTSTKYRLVIDVL
jgi:hypothetical protein